MKKIYYSIIISLFFGISAHATIIYVNTNLSSNGNGTSWTNANNDLDTAISNASRYVCDNHSSRK